MADVVAERREVVIGTSDHEEHHVDPSIRNNNNNMRVECEDDGNHNNNDEDDQQRVQQPAIADVEAHVAAVRRLVLRRPLIYAAMQPTTTSSSSSCGDGVVKAYDGIVIRADELERINDIADMLDQVAYWAAEEATTFVEEPSQLAQAEVPELIMACILCERPRLITIALGIAANLLRHAQSASELKRVAAMYVPQQQQASSSSSSSRDASLLVVVEAVLMRYPNVAALTVAACDLLCVLMHVRLLAAFLRSGLMSALLATLEKHMDQPRMALSITQLIARVADLHGNDDDNDDDVDVEEEEQLPAPAAVLLCHVGVVRTFMIDAMRASWSSLEVKRAVIHFICVCAVHAHNRQLLMDAGAYTVVARALPTLQRCEDVFVEAAEAVGYFIAMLDEFQMASLVLILRDALLRCGEAESHGVVLALLLSLFMIRASRHNNNNNKKIHECGSSGGMDVYARYAAMLPAAHGPAPPRTTTTTTRTRSSSSKAHIVMGELIRDHDDDESWDALLERSQIRQVVAHLMDFYRQTMPTVVVPVEELGYDEDAEEVAIRRVFNVAQRCMALSR